MIQKGQAWCFTMSSVKSRKETNKSEPQAGDGRTKPARRQPHAHPKVNHTNFNIIDLERPNVALRHAIKIT